jgi:glycosyltransferase involved in cell wall biosynthesis
MVKVSVIIPNYNHANYLRQRIDSVLAQSYDDFEIIILDDFSTDNSREIIESYRDSNKISSIIYNDQNSGSTFKQWEKGIAAAKGKYIWIAESDDYSKEFLLEEAIKHLESPLEKVGVFYCNSTWVDENGNFLYEFPFSESKGFNSGHEFIVKFLSLGNSIFNASAVVFRRDLVKLPLTEELVNMKYCGDWFFWVRLLEETNIFVSDNFLNFFRRHSKNIGTKAEIDGLPLTEGIKIYSYIRKKYKKDFHPFCLNDKKWALSFSHSNLDSKKRWSFIFDGGNASLFIPALYYYYRFKSMLKLIKG